MESADEVGLALQILLLEGDHDGAVAEGTQIRNEGGIEVNHGEREAVPG
jgi:hypothetical protein